VLPERLFYFGGPEIDTTGGDSSVDFDSYKLRGHLIALSPDLLAKPSVVRKSAPKRSFSILLPDLAGISPDLICRIREDEGILFSQFHQTIASLLHLSRSVDSEQRLLDLFSEVDKGVRALDKTFKRLAHMRALKVAGVTTGVVALAVFALFPALVPDYIKLVIGSKSALDLYEFILSRESSEDQIRGNPLYVAWKLHHESRRGRRRLTRGGGAP
jgi:hypothetical protein